MAAFIWAGGNAVFIVFLVVFTLAVIFGLYTRGGSGINQRPYHDAYGDAPGATKAPSTLSHDETVVLGRPRGTR
jgi:hypothetical protein